MKGQLLKDLMNLKQQWKIYIGIIVIWAAVCIIDKSTSLIYAYMIIFILFIPISAMAYDERSKWERFALTMPTSRLDLVLSKYILAVICGAVSMAFSIIVGVITTGDLLQSAAGALTFLGIGIALVSLILPAIFKFGTEKGRIIMIAIIFIPTIIIMLIKEQIGAPSEKVISSITTFLPLAAVVLLAVSILVSKRIYEKKEF